MKNISIFYILIISILSINFIDAQTIKDDAYKNLYLKEDFNMPGDYFPIVTTNENYFIIDDGDYLMSRNNNESEYAVIANSSLINNFILKTSVRIGPSKNKNASIGVIMKAQQDGKGAIIFELNKKGEYRLKKLINNDYTNISNSENNGWIKNNEIKTEDLVNKIEIRCENNLYEILINNFYVNSFEIQNFKEGYTGIIISPATKARLDYFYLNKKGEKNNLELFKNQNHKKNKKIDQNIEKKYEEIQTENNTQKQEIVKLKKQIKNYNIEIENIRKNEIENNKIEILEQENSNLKNKLQIVENKNIKQNNKLKEQDSILNKLQIENQKLQDDLNNENQLTELFNKQLSEIKKEKKELKNKEVKLRNTIQEKKKIITEKENENKSLKQKIINENEIAELLNKQLSKIKKENENLNLNNSKLNNTIKNQKQKIDIKENENQELQKNINLEKNLSKSLNQKIKKIKNELTAKQEQNLKLNKKLKEVNKKEKELIENLENKILISNTKIDSLIKINIELQQLFLIKDFESKNIDKSKLIKKTAVTPIEEKNQKKHVGYSVQIGVYINLQSKEKFSNLDEVWHEESEYGSFIYLSGRYDSIKDASEHKSKLVQLGYTNAFVVSIME
tara:strand:+ start:4371 stop:6236 length:1866 start_codon:yes stop_codon:yes gene_type:complete